jgi:hypothetical protein
MHAEAAVSRDWIDEVREGRAPAQGKIIALGEEPIGQTCRRARCSQATPASGRRSRAPAARPQISLCRPKRITASRG